MPETTKNLSEKQHREAADNPDDSHWHWEIFLPLLEVSQYHVGDSCHSVSPRTALVCDRWVPHWLEPNADARTPARLIIHGHEHVWCNVPSEDVDADVHTAEGLWVNLPLELSVFFHSRWAAYQASELPRRKAAEALLRRPVELVLEEYLRLVSGHGVIRANEAPASIVTLVKGRMESLNGVDCSLSDMAHFAGYSRFALAHLFKSQTGMSIGEYRDQVRRDYLCRAQVLGLKTKEIAVGLGFSSASAYLNWKSSRPAGVLSNTRAK